MQEVNCMNLHIWVSNDKKKHFWTANEYKTVHWVRCWTAIAKTNRKRFSERTWNDFELNVAKLQTGGCVWSLAVILVITHWYCWLMVLFIIWHLMMVSHYLPRDNAADQSPHLFLIEEDNIDLNQWVICQDFQC